MWFGFITSFKSCLQMSKQQTTFLEGNHTSSIQINLLTGHRSGALSLRVVAACPLLSPEIIRGQAFVNNVGTALP